MSFLPTHPFLSLSHSAWCALYFLRALESEPLLPIEYHDYQVDEGLD